MPGRQRKKSGINPLKTVLKLQSCPHFQVKPHFVFEACRFSEPDDNVDGEARHAEKPLGVGQRRNERQRVAWLQRHRVSVSDINIIIRVGFVVHPDGNLVDKLQVGIAVKP